MGAVNLPVALLSGLGGLAALMTERFDYSSWLRVPFLAAMVASGITFAWTVALLARAYVGPTTTHLPTPRDMAEFQASLEALYLGMDLPAARADADFREQLTRWYIDAAERNRSKNDRQTAHLTRAGQGLVAVLLALTACGILYLADALRRL